MRLREREWVRDREREKERETERERQILTQIDAEQQVSSVKLQRHKVALVTVGIQQHTVLVAGFEAQFDYVLCGAGWRVQSGEIIEDVPVPSKPCHFWG